MDIFWHEKALSGCQFVLYLILLHRAGRTGLVRRFPLFYGFVIWRVGVDVAGWFVILRYGLGSWTFLEYYSFGLFGDRFFMLLLTFEMLRLVDYGRLGLSRTALGAVTIGLTWPALIHSASGFVHQPFTGGLALTGLLLMGCVTFHSLASSRIILGDNHIGLLGGLLLKSCLDCGLVAAVSLDWTPYRSLRPWIQPMSLLPWGVWAFAMRRGSPSRKLSEAAFGRLVGLRDDVAGTVRKRIRRG